MSRDVMPHFDLETIHDNDHRALRLHSRVAVRSRRQTWSGSESSTMRTIGRSNLWIANLDPSLRMVRFMNCWRRQRFFDVAISAQSKAGKDTVALISIETLISRQRSASAARAASA